MLIAQRPSLAEEQVDDYRSRFVIEPLEPGFGYTIGNSLRRTLLSSIPGAAVTSIRIEGVLHEFSTVPGVKEDVTDIILNLKSLVVSSEHDEPVVMYLRKQGPGEVTAADIAPRGGGASPGKTLVELFGLARELNVEAEGIDMGPSPTDAALAADLALPIEELNLTVRSYNCLKREGIHSVGELVARSEQDLLDIRNFGAKSIEEVKQKLIDMGLALKDSPPGFDPGSAVDSYAADDDAYVETEQY